MIPSTCEQMYPDLYFSNMPIYFNQFHGLMKRYLLIKSNNLKDGVA